jgi:flagellar biosynthesis activator protein FlaF
MKRWCWGTVMSLNAYRSAHSRAETPRQAEYRLFAEVTAALAEAKRTDARGTALVEALDWNRRLWSALAADCSGDGNALPRELRAQIVSVGLWVSRHATEVARGRGDIDALIDVNRSIMEGLAMQPASLPEPVHAASVGGNA